MRFYRRSCGALLKICDFSIITQNLAKLNIIGGSYMKLFVIE